MNVISIFISQFFANFANHCGQITLFFILDKACRRTIFVKIIMFHCL
jgi:hypothetical protein